MKTQFKKGQISWNKGLTYEYDSRIPRPWLGKTRSEETKQKQREKALKRTPLKKNTSIEIMLQKELSKRGIKYETHFPVCGICQPDIVFPNKKIAVFADGDYWHAKEFKEGLVWRRDRKQERVLEDDGWRVLRFWGHELRENVEKCVDMILELN